MGYTLAVHASPRRGRIGAIISLGCTRIAAAVLLLAPLGSQQAAVATTQVATQAGEQAGEQGAPQVVGQAQHVSLLQHEGPSVLVPLAVPVVIALLGAVAGLFRSPKVLRTVSAGLLTAFVLFGALSIGVFFLPSAIAMGVAAARTAGSGAPARGDPGSCTPSGSVW